MSGFLQRLQGEIQNRRLLLPAQKILAAVSGGLDSMALLHALQALAEESRWQITAAHFNHQLRGRASDADENLVRETAARLGLPFVSGRADVKKIAKRSKLSIEMAARKLRHEFLARAARERRISTIALAHHAGDQVELFFLRVLRGAGGEGLAGMKRRSPSPADKKISLARPLLGFSKSELHEFARQNKIRFREDASNAGPDFLRNRIRGELLPLLHKKYQPGLAKTVLRLMEIVGAEAEFAGAAAQAWLERRGMKSENFPAKNFEGLPVAVQRKVLQLQLLESGVAVDFELVEQLRQAPGKVISVGQKLSVAREVSGKIQIAAAGKRFEKFSANEFKLEISGRAGRARFGGRQFRWQVRAQKQFEFQRKKSAAAPPPHELFDADKIGDEVILRHWRAGDRFQPIGLKSPVKLQDLFVNAKIPAAARRGLVLAATAAGEIFWVEGLRIGEKFKLTPATARQLVWNCSNFAEEFALQPAVR